MNTPSDHTTQKLMVSGNISSESGGSAYVMVRRWMPIYASDGSEVGKVAAVVLNSESQTVTHLLLSRLPEVGGYWLVSLDLIAHVDEEKIQLSILGEAAEELPRWHSE